MMVLNGVYSCQAGTRDLTPRPYVTGQYAMLVGTADRLSFILCQLFNDVADDEVEDSERREKWRQEKQAYVDSNIKVINL